MRMSESRRRTYLYNQLSMLEKQITEQWNRIKKTYGDEVTYSGRNYLDKMQFDKLEMLHYLQEERRLNYLHSYTSIDTGGQLNSTFNHVLWMISVLPLLHESPLLFFEEIFIFDTFVMLPLRPFFF